MPLILPQCAIRINPFKHDYHAAVVPAFHRNPARSNELVLAMGAVFSGIVPPAAWGTSKEVP
jgi:hypothetical protein